ncbi:MAG: hypothetical protein HY706_20600 [Candidatus Hydrogenedentes bacterium]|nr:hypothetical protein [Candidatus Hydrogenedentota bacterium]
MSEFPHTTVGGVSLSRMIIGTNWFLGWSHQTAAKDNFIKSHQDAKKIADILEVYLAAGIDTILGPAPVPLMMESVREAQERTGKGMIIVDTPWVPLAAGGVDFDKAAAVLDDCAKRGAQFCLPHSSAVDALVDRTTRTIRDMDKLCALIRERGMTPGLSTHMPETPIYADESGLDVETYIQIYNAAGFLMQVEVEWVHRIIQNAKKPVMTIKPMAAGRLSPLVGLAFVWSTIRDQDMVTVGALTPDEAKEDIEISRSILERRTPEVTLQRTRSKRSVEKSTAPAGLIS